MAQLQPQLVLIKNLVEKNFSSKNLWPNDILLNNFSGNMLLDLRIFFKRNCGKKMLWIKNFKNEIRVKQAHQCISCVWANKFYIPLLSFIPIPFSLSIYPYPFIPIPLSLFLYPYPFIPIPLSLSLYPYPFILIPQRANRAKW